MRILNKIFIFEEILPLFKEAFNIKNKNTLKLRHKYFYGKLIFVVFLILILSIIFVKSTDEHKEIFDLFSTIINFYSITVGFTISALVFLAGDFNKFKKEVISGFSDKEQEDICKQLSSTLLMSIYFNIYIILLGIFNNYLIFNIDVPLFFHDFLEIINIVYTFIIFSLFLFSILLLFISLKHLKKYIELTIKAK